MEYEYLRWKTLAVVEVVIVCEGSTEERFVRHVLATPFGYQSVFLLPRVINGRTRGGNLRRNKVLRFLRNTLRERIDTYVTTMFDLYGLPSDFPGRLESVHVADPIERSRAIEREFRRITIDKIQCRSDRFIPHIQPYEFESLLFSDVTHFGDVEARWKARVSDLRRIRASFPSPEYINDGPHTHPSARLEHLPGYRKPLHGAVISQRIGLDRIRHECQHFSQWLDRIENLPPLREPAR